MTYEKQAQNLLSHYFKQLYEAAGLVWNNDSEAEMGEIVEAIKSAVISEQEVLQCGACGATMTRKKLT